MAERCLSCLFLHLKTNTETADAHFTCQSTEKNVWQRDIASFVLFRLYKKMLLAYYSKYFIPATNEIEFILKKVIFYIHL